MTVKEHLDKGRRVDLILYRKKFTADIRKILINI